MMCDVCLCACAGEFGSVREAFLKTEDSSVQKVAVKVLKCEFDICSSSLVDVGQCGKRKCRLTEQHKTDGKVSGFV